MISMSDFLKAKFEYLLLAAFMLILGGFLILVLHSDPVNPKAFDWASNAYSSLQGALLGLITGRSLALRTTDKNGNGNGKPIDSKGV